jgi:DNA-binding transcriptional ArsR family regulator
LNTRQWTSPGDVSECVKMLGILAQPTRLAVLQALIDSGPKHVNELQTLLGVEQSTLSHHLRVLRDAGLVDSSTDGKRRLYSAVEGSSRTGIDLGCCELTFARLRKAAPRTRGARRRSASAARAKGR